MKNSAEYKELKKILISRGVKGYHDREFFRFWLQAVWAFLSGDTELYQKELGQYNVDEGKLLGKMFNLYVEAAEVFQFQDILGELFQEIDSASVRAGQFFTPWPLALINAQVTFDEKTFDQDTVTVHDPACGSGIMLLAFASITYERLGVLGLNKLRLSGQDIDNRCILMSKIQLRINGLDTLGRRMRLFGALENLALQPV